VRADNSFIQSLSKQDLLGLFDKGAEGTDLQCYFPDMEKKENKKG